MNFPTFPILPKFLHFRETKISQNLTLGPKKPQLEIEPKIMQPTKFPGPNNEIISNKVEPKMKEDINSTIISDIAIKIISKDIISCILKCLLFT